MSQNSASREREILKIKEFGVVNSEKTENVDYRSLFYSHLMQLLKPKFVANNNLGQLSLNVRSYYALEQLSLEHAEKFELDLAKEIDWEHVDFLREVFKDEVRGSFAKKKWTDPKYDRLISFSADVYESSLIYDQMFPGSMLNPWIPAVCAVKKGHLLGIADDRDTLDEYNRKIYRSNQISGSVEADNQQDFSNLGVISKEVKDNSKTSGFMVDGRHSIQGMIFDYLRTSASGRGAAKTIKQIEEYLTTIGKPRHYLYVKNSVLLPLKRASIIGSTNSGYYYLAEKEDFIATYRSHKSKIKRIEATIDQFRARYRDLFSGSDLELDSK